MRLWVYAVRRGLLAIPVLLGIMTVLFIVFSALPAPQPVCSFGPSPNGEPPCSPTVPCPTDPSQLCPNPAYEAGYDALGLNQPIYVQWFLYMGNALTFHWGTVSSGSALGTGVAGSGLPSLAGQSVSTLIAQFLPYSLELLALTMTFVLLLAVPIHRWARAHPGGPADRAARALAFPGYGIPIFIVGALALAGVTAALGGAAGPSPICGSGSTVFLDVYGSWPVPPCTPLYGTANIGPLGFPNWLHVGYISTPTGFPTLDAALHGNGWLALDTVLRMVLPALLLAVVGAGVVFRRVQFSPFDRSASKYVRAARAEGLPDSEVTGRMAGRSSLADVVSAIGPALVMVLGMLPIVEVMFNLWGIGVLFSYSVVGGLQDMDFAVTFGVMLTCALLAFSVSIAMDILRAWLDPRFRLERGNDRGSGTVPEASAGAPARSTERWATA